ncbi:hypothetical protein [Pedobacter rhizosphaerae]|uniref:CobQ/CobB/MinD/ParA nucleotide binding domain-containing protein n=1 Tax=Pedobacter rhizosphaerae TaxID=390241 RepID=A0A1H9N581_9SPHI|nr:hypothetical protein [Pedobacter rhizosphaerae]SER30829.1 hypothetical protein SAMN04488023_10737 [Pedobacter rhizosphaerae]
MIIGIGNCKGGSGSSVLSLLLAHYLAQQTQDSISLVSIAAGSLSLLHSRSTLLEHELPFEFLTCSFSHFKLLVDKLAENKSAWIILDFPPVGNDEKIIELILKADFICCPFSYDMDSVHNSLTFGSLCRRIQPEVKLLFVPNRVVANASYPLRDETERTIRQIAAVGPALSMHIGLQRLSSLQLPTGLLEKFSTSLQVIFENYLKHAKPSNF